MNSIFIHIPKTGGLTIEKALNLVSMRHRARINNRIEKYGELKGNLSFGHMPYDKLLREGIIDPVLHRTSFKYAICRNPYDRAVSHWCYVMKKHPNLVKPETSFLDFSREIYDDRIRRHFREQHLYVKDIRIDFQGYFERYFESLQQIADMIGVNLQSIPHENSTSHRPYYEYYCEESKQNILNFYKKDFEYFGYDINDNLLHR